jgi:hypothetical protein
MYLKEIECEAMDWNQRALGSDSAAGYILPGSIRVTSLLDERLLDSQGRLLPMELVLEPKCPSRSQKPVDPVLRNINLVHQFTLYFSKDFNIILLYLICFHRKVFQTIFSMHFFLSPHACHVSLQSYAS